MSAAAAAAATSSILLLRTLHRLLFAWPIFQGYSTLVWVIWKKFLGTVGLASIQNQIRIKSTTLLPWKVGMCKHTSVSAFGSKRAKFVKPRAACLNSSTLHGDDVETMSHSATRCCARPPCTQTTRTLRLCQQTQRHTSIIHITELKLQYTTGTTKLHFDSDNRCL